MFDPDENEKRKGKYYKSPTDEEFLNSLNEELVELEKTYHNPEPNQGPLLFLFGIPRSGTTLFYQFLAHCLDVGFMDNLMARFWKAPLTGIKLSEILLGERQRTNFNSDVGQTEFISEPHEFGYFWSDLFDYDDNRLGDLDKDINWDKVKNKVLNIQNLFGKPTIFKNLVYAFHLEKFDSLFEEALFISIERNLLDTALSILKTREERYGNKSEWWSVRPKNFDDLVKEPYWIQIPEQMKQLKARYEKGIDQSEDMNFLRIKYRNLCENPRSVLKKVKVQAEQTGFEIEERNIPPESFTVSSYENHEDYEKLKSELEERFSEDLVT
jgi:hypothetical protein